MWAKSGSGGGHGVLAHLLDVAAVTETLLEREPESTRRWAATQFGMSSQTVARWLTALAGLHDFGKAIPGFENKWPAGMQADLPRVCVFRRPRCGAKRRPGMIHWC